jgi:hypothetical protein
MIWQKLLSAPFKVAAIQSGRVTALKVDRKTCKVLTGSRREEARFDLSLAPYLEVGDLMVMEPTKDVSRPLLE